MSDRVDLFRSPFRPDNHELPPLTFPQCKSQVGAQLNFSEESRTALTTTQVPVRQVYDCRLSGLRPISENIPRTFISLEWRLFQYQYLGKAMAVDSAGHHGQNRVIDFDITE
jgi:hypothetical protein